MEDDCAVSCEEVGTNESISISDRMGTVTVGWKLYSGGILLRYPQITPAGGCLVGVFDLL
jgi:hypothetical protein